MARVLTMALMLLVIVPAADETVTELSGVVRVGDELLLVADNLPGIIFRHPVPTAAAGTVNLDPAALHRTPLTGGALALDPEEVDILADGRIVLLSERLHCLIGEQGVIVQFASFTTEFGNRGLEGLAVRPLADGASRIAALWEGGQPFAHDLPAAIECALSNPKPVLPPFVVYHDLPAGGHTGWAAGNPVILRLPAPPDPRHFLRAPDLLWCRLPGLEADWGLLALLSSDVLAQHRASGERPGRYNALQRFTVWGEPVGSPLWLVDAFGAELGDDNWEGIAWLDEGSRIILVADRKEGANPLAIVDLPEEWRPRER